MGYKCKSCAWKAGEFPGESIGTCDACGATRGAVYWTPPRFVITRDCDSHYTLSGGLDGSAPLNRNAAELLLGGPIEIDRRIEIHVIRGAEGPRFRTVDRDNVLAIYDRRLGYDVVAVNIFGCSEELKDGLRETLGNEAERLNGEEGPR